MYAHWNIAKSLIFGALLAAFVFSAQMVVAKARLALVIGNSQYEAVTSLKNPINDAKLISRSLKKVGFQTITVLNSDRKQLIGAIKKFMALVTKDTEAFIYYAGHGIQYNSENYLLPADVNLQTASDLPLDAIGLSIIHNQISERKPKIAIIVLDACRNNPLEGLIGKDAQGGLARATGPLGTYIAYATAPGSVALDGSGDNSPFSRALSDYITKPGLPIEQVFKRVRERVFAESNGTQIPWDNSALVDEFFFQQILTNAPRTFRSSQLDANDWKTAIVQNTKGSYRKYLKQHPDGLFADLARVNISSKAKPASTTVRQSASKNEKTGMSSDIADWNAANSAGTPDNYKKYISAHPDGLFVKLAKLRLEDKTSNAANSVTGITSVLSANFEEFADTPLYPEVTQCDHLAGHVQESADPAVGVFFKEIEPQKAVAACLEALDQFPNSMRLLINYARAIDADGRHDEAREIYKAGTEIQFPIAYRSLGDVYRDGRGIEKNLKEARYWYVLGAEKNNVFAQLNLALIYEKGLDVPVDRKKAFYWLWRAGRQGFASAMEKLAGYYLKGDVVKKDEKQGAILLQSAAEMGNMWAELNLGDLYLNGTGVQKDQSTGRIWVERAAIQGNQWAQAKLASLYKDGIGIDQDEAEALKWAYVARNAGIDWVKDMISYLETKTGKNNILIAEKFAKEYKPRKVK